MKTQSHARFWFGVLVVCMLVVPYFIPAAVQEQRINNEVDAVYALFGTKVAGWIVECSNDIHHVIADDTGISAFLRKGMSRHDEIKKARDVASFLGEGGAVFANRFLAAMLLQIYGATLRACIVVTWLIVLAPFLLAGWVDGLGSRAVKLTSFSDINPTAFSLGLHLSLLVGVLPLFYIAVPVGISPLFMPVWAIVAMVPALLTLSHTQRMLS